MRYREYRAYREQEKEAFTYLGKGLYHAGRGLWGGAKLLGRGARSVAAPLARPVPRLIGKSLKAGFRTPRRAMFTGSAGISAYFVADAFKQNPRLTRSQVSDYKKLKKNNQEASNMSKAVPAPPVIPQTHYGQFNAGAGLRKSASWVEAEMRKEALRRMGRVSNRRVLLRPGRPPRARKLRPRRTRRR